MTEEDFTRLYRLFGSRLYNCALWILHDRQGAADAVQKAFLKSWQSPRFPDREEEQRAWLIRSVKNAALDIWRSRRRRTDFHESYRRELAAMPGSHVDESVWELLDVLSPEDRYILYLHLHERYTYKEIARFSSLAAGNVRVRAFRALKRLRSELEKRSSHGQ